MSERWRQFVEAEQERLYGGRIPIEIEHLMDWAVAEVTKILAGKGLHPEMVYTIRMQVGDLAVRIAREVIHKERMVDGLSEEWWTSGFGLVTEMEPTDVGGGPTCRCNDSPRGNACRSQVSVEHPSPST
jgi:hypothetical protein